MKLMIIRKGIGFYIMIFLCLVGLSRCHDTIDSPMTEDKDLTDIPYHSVVFLPDIPPGFPSLEQPPDNPMTVDGIRLGRKLFFDPILSVDSTISCSSCHQQGKSFTDDLPSSPGVAGNTSRSSLNLINAGFQFHRFFWDGRATTLEDQAIQPVENRVEMGETWENVELKLRRHPDYQIEFRKAFGIPLASKITKDLVTKALAQFERTIISGGNSRYDRIFLQGMGFPDEHEYNGYLMFFQLDPANLPDAQCGHCHAGPLLGTTDYFNNGLQEAVYYKDFPDKGLGAISGDSLQNGLFKTPTLRNLVFTSPYMHDGRFKTLSEVMDHYMSGGHPSPNKNPFLNQIHLTESQKSDVIAFLLMLTDSTVLTNPAYKNPF